MRPATRSKSADLIAHARPYHLLQNIFVHYLNLPCFAIRTSGARDWQALVSSRVEGIRPMDFENVRQWKERVAYNNRSIARAARTGRAVWGPLNGLHGIFAPILRRGVCQGVLQSGVFLTRLPTETELLRLWKNISGRAPGLRDVEFLNFTRSVAATPVLDAVRIKAVIELMEIFGAFLCGDLSSELAAGRMEALQRDVFAPAFCHRGWLDWQVFHRTFYRFYGNAKELLPWEKEEFGVEEFPNTVVLALRESTGKEWADLLAAPHFWALARRRAKELGNTLVYPNAGDGVLLLTHASGSETDAVRRGIDAKIARFRESMQRTLGCRIWIGVGRPDPDGTRLVDSYHEAVAAAQMALTQNRAVVHHCDLPMKPTGSADIRNQGEALAHAAMQKGRGKVALLGTYIQAVLIQTQGRPDSARLAFERVIDRLAAALETIGSLDRGTIRELEERIQSRLESAVGLHELVERFREGFDQILVFLESPSQGDKVQRIQRAAAAVAEAAQAPWDLPETARRFGFSASSFSRTFSTVMGLNFSDHVVEKRMELAGKLLRDGRPPSQVAKLCGFNSVSYFNTVFKRKFGVPPGHYAKPPVPPPLGIQNN